jgi:hypothetical protein
MSSRNLDCLDFGELAAFLATNSSASALDAVLASLVERSGGKVRRLVSAMRATVAAIGEQPAADVTADLLAALKTIVRRIDNGDSIDDPDWHEITAARAAIARAESR